MSIERDFLEIEQKLKNKDYMNYPKDGILDIIIGWDILFTGIFLLTHSVVYIIPGLLPLFFIAPIKKWITLPRLGHASFRLIRTTPMKLIGGLGAVLLLAAILFGILRESFSGGIALALIGIAFLMFLQTSFSRIFAYVIFIPVFFIVGLGSGYLSPEIVVFVGAGFIFMGVWYLIRFLQNNPVISEDE